MNANDNEPPQKAPQPRTVSKLLDYFGHILSREPQNREELLELLRDAEQRQLLDLHALNMMEGVLQVSEMQVSDIMVPRSEMAIVSHDAKPDDFLPLIIESGHSRFPVLNQETDEIIGILLAKDLLRYLFQNKTQPDLPFELKGMMRPPVFVPENTRLDRLLQEFRIKHMHMAIVIDEYGSIAGLATIEDVLEQIVGDIEDEYDDLDEDEDFIKKYSETRYVIKAVTPLQDFNTYFGCSLDNNHEKQNGENSEDSYTIGDLIMSRFDHPPKRGEIITIDQFRFKILHSDGRQIRLLSLLIRKRMPGGINTP